MFEFSLGGFGEQKIFLSLPLYFILFRFLIVRDKKSRISRLIEANTNV